MKHAIKGFSDIPSVMKLGQWRRVRSQIKYEHEILSELAQLSREKAWLNKQKKNWQERISRINVRLSDIEKMENELLQKQMAIKDQISLDAEKDKQGSDTEAIEETHEMIIKY